MTTSSNSWRYFSIIKQKISRTKMNVSRFENFKNIVKSTLIDVDLKITVDVFVNDELDKFRFKIFNIEKNNLSNDEFCAFSERMNVKKSRKHVANAKILCVNDTSTTMFMNHFNENDITLFMKHRLNLNSNQLQRREIIDLIYKTTRLSNKKECRNDKRKRIEKNDVEKIREEKKRESKKRRINDVNDVFAIYRSIKSIEKTQKKRDVSNNLRRTRKQNNRKKLIAKAIKNINNIKINRINNIKINRINIKNIDNNIKNNSKNNESIIKNIENNNIIIKNIKTSERNEEIKKKKNEKHVNDKNVKSDKNIKSIKNIKSNESIKTNKRLRHDK